ncbi:hypothetical protein AB0M92_19815 [Streptomyces sp. NPDC051582]
MASSGSADRPTTDRLKNVLALVGRLAAGAASGAARSLCDWLLGDR